MRLHRDSPEKRVAGRLDDDVDDEDDYDDGNRNIILSLIGQLRPGSDLSRITLPTFILERKSMLERITNILQHPQMLVEATSCQNPEQRFIEIVRWYMSGWYIAPKAVKKPLNPVLGEYFSCYWDLEDNSRAYYIAEQTSHHAPKSSYFFALPQRKIRADGIVIPKSKFLGNSAASIMEGVARLTLGEHVDSRGQPEVYELTQPNIYVRNVLVGTLKLEIGDKAVVTCPALDMKCVVEFKVKGYIYGTYHEIKGTITHKDEPLYEITGKWNEVIYIKSLKGKGKKEVFFDTNQDRVHKPSVRPIAEQGPLESRRLWEKVCHALSEKNQKIATDEKFFIEDRQRDLQKLRSEGKEPPFTPRLFEPVNEPLEFLICADQLLNRAQSPQEVEDILQSFMPILPGAKFPNNFDESAADKAKHTRHTSRGPSEQSSSNPNVAGVAPLVDDDGDEFVDAPEFN